MDTKKKLKVYISAGWFSEEQRYCLDILEKYLFSKEELEVFSPRRVFVLKPDSTLEEKQRVFEDNLRNIEDADLIISSIEGKDMGTLFENGYAFAKNKKIIYTWFTAKPGQRINVMLSQSGIASFTNVNDFINYMEESLKNNLFKKIVYEGEVE